MASLGKKFNGKSICQDFCHGSIRSFELSLRLDEPGLAPPYPFALWKRFGRLCMQAVILSKHSSLSATTKVASRILELETTASCLVLGTLNAPSSPTLSSTSLTYSFAAGSSSPVRAFLFVWMRSCLLSRAALVLARLASISSFSALSRAASALALWI